jgi:RNA polymerase sigma-70 factor (ECF subfamily)
VLLVRIVTVPPMPAGTESDLARRLADLYKQHSPQVYTLCLRLSGDAGLAEELAQDAWVRIWHKLPALRRDDDAGGWIHRVTTNVVRNDRRATRRRVARVALSADLSGGLPESAEANRAPFATPTPIRRIDLLAAISTLGGRQREVYVLHDIEGLTDRDIADRLRIAPSTVRVLLARARATLRDILRP